MANEHQLPFPLGGIGRSSAHATDSIETTPDSENVIPYDPLDHRYRGGSRPGFPAVEGFELDDEAMFMVAYSPAAELEEKFRQSLLIGTKKNLYANVPLQIGEAGSVEYGELYRAFAEPIDAEQSITLVLAPYENSEEQIFKRPPDGIWSYLGVNAVGLDSAAVREYLRPDGESKYLRPDEQSVYRFAVGALSGPLLTEGDDRILASDLDLGETRTLAAPYQGSVVIPGSGKVLYEGRGALFFGLFIAEGQLDWEGVVPYEHVLEVSPIEGPGFFTVQPATYRIVFSKDHKLFVTPPTVLGPCRYRVVDGPKFVVADKRAILPLHSRVGHLPIGADLIAGYLDRLVFVKDRVWHMSRQGDATDYNYGADAGDVGRAVAGFASDAGLPGDPIMALATRGDDYLVLMARESTWVMMGDPAANGLLVNVSRQYGCVDPQAWCIGDGGEIYFLSREGLCILEDGAQNRPVPVSAGALPNALRNFDANNTLVSCEFDVRYRGVWIFLTPKGEGNTTHYYYSKITNSFWPIRFTDAGHQPTVAALHSRSPADGARVFICSKDKQLRYASGSIMDTEDGVPSRVILGPFVVGDPASDYDSVLTHLVTMFGGVNADLHADVFAASSPEAAVDAAISGEPTFSVRVRGRRSPVSHPRVRGVAFCVRLRSTGVWGYEGVSVTATDAGRAR